MQEGTTNEIRDTIRYGAVNVCRKERPPAPSRTTRALEDWNAHTKEGLGGDTDVVRLNERNKRVGSGQIGIEDECSVHFNTRLREHATCSSFCVILVLIAEASGERMLMAAPNPELKPKIFKILKSEVAGAWAVVSHVLRGFYELADILVLLDEVF